MWRRCLHTTVQRWRWPDRRDPTCSGTVSFHITTSFPLFLITIITFDLSKKGSRSPMREDLSWIGSYSGSSSSLSGHLDSGVITPQIVCSHRAAIVWLYHWTRQDYFTPLEVIFTICLIITKATKNLANCCHGKTFVRSILKIENENPFAITVLKTR